MKERGISQRVNKITSIEINKPVLLETLGYVSDLIGDTQEKPNIGSLIKVNKMTTYKQLINQLNPVVHQFRYLRKTHVDLIQSISLLDQEINACIDKTTSAVKFGKHINTELNLIKSKKHLIDAIIDKIASDQEIPPGQADNESVATAVNKLIPVDISTLTKT
jgi:hypothetical protein